MSPFNNLEMALQIDEEVNVSLIIKRKEICFEEEIIRREKNK